LPKKGRNKCTLRILIFSKENGGFEFVFKTAARLMLLFSAAKYQLPQLRFFLFAAGQLFLHFIDYPTSGQLDPKLYYG